MHYIKLILIMLLLAGCTAAPTSTATNNPPPAILPSGATPTPEFTYEIYAWVDKPEPKLGEVVNVSGHLVRNGAYLGSIPMWMFWPEENGAPGENSCMSYMMYQRGICAIIVEGYPAGVYIPVRIRVEHDGKFFTTETGFTPQED